MKQRQSIRKSALLLVLLAFFTVLRTVAETTAPGGGGSSAVETTTTGRGEAVDKVYRIVEEDGQGSILSEPTDFAFWEYPLLPAGQQKSGSFRVVNNSSRAVSLTMTPDLPYNDETALTYMAGLHILIEQEDGTPVYEGPYTGLADRVPLISIGKLGAGESTTYTITLRCPFAYTGDPEMESSAVSWDFHASARIVTEPAGNPARDWIMLGFIVAAAFLVVGGVLLAVRFVRRRSKTKKENA